MLLIYAFAVIDPLKILYLFILADDNEQQLTPFQGFSRSWTGLAWALRQVPACPADIIEPSQPANEILTQRISGIRQLTAAPFSMGSLAGVSIRDLGYFCVLFASDADTAEKIDKWNANQPWRALHIRPEQHRPSFQNSEWFNLIKEHCEEVFKVVAKELPEAHRQAASDALKAWRLPSVEATDHPQLGHNIFLPNQMTLSRAFRDVREEKGWVGESEAEYAKWAVESARAVLKVRKTIEWRPLHALYPPPPALILTEPALYRFAYKRPAPQGLMADKSALAAMRHFQKQQGLYTAVTEEEAKVLDQPGGRAIVGARRAELITYALGVGLRASSTLSACLRLTPGVNQVFPKLANYARSIRTERPEHKLKALRLFQSIQNDLKDALGPERMSFIESVDGPLKIVSDAPLELLPLGELPLSLARECSRINATPGNLMLAELARNKGLYLHPANVRKILVVSTLSESDRLYRIMERAIDFDAAVNNLDVKFVRAKTEAAFIDALNDFDGGVMIFDGHGAGNHEDPVGGLMVGDKKIDVWNLRDRVRVPPIVLLSACDTHALDGLSHATAANGFLFLGAQTVLATILPIGGFEGAMFIHRLLWRLSAFLEPALSVKKGSLTWTEIITGMLRMVLVSEILDHRIGRPDSPARTTEKVEKLNVEANIAINTGRLDWYEAFLQDLADHLGEDAGTTRSRARSVIARCEALRYVQLGSPEHILVDDGSVQRRVLDAYGLA